MKRLVRKYLPEHAVDTLKRWRSVYHTKFVPSQSPQEYWTRYHVNAPSEFTTIEESLAHLRWRNTVNLGQLEVMPVDDVSGKVVLDYGCGPGNDVIGFGHYSKPTRLLACDVSPTALAIARQRAALHGIEAEFSQIKEFPVSLPYDNASIDVIHTAGVLHHTTDPVSILSEFHRVLKPNGEVRIMVYNRDSIWMHLYVSYVLMLERGLYKGLSPDEAFHFTTDGEACPIARCYRPGEFVSLCSKAGFNGRFQGAGITISEIELLPKRWAALSERLLPEESRDFLYNLHLNERGWPLHMGYVAGINGYYRCRYE